MNVNELADLIEFDAPIVGINKQAAAMLRQQAEQLAKYKYVLESIANEYVELSHDKIKWQNEDHIKWAKEALK
jgi:FKBP-type peptidyl-prolyl cis-trans isomerase (trigger factor)